MAFQYQFSRVVEDMVDDAAIGVVDDVVCPPVIHAIDIQVVSQEIVLQLLCLAKLANGEDVGLHIVHQGADTFVFALRVVVRLVTVGVTATVVAVLQQVILHHGEGVLCLDATNHHQGSQKTEKTSHLDTIYMQK